MRYRSFPPAVVLAAFVATILMTVAVSGQWDITLPNGKQLFAGSSAGTGAPCETK